MPAVTRFGFEGFGVRPAGSFAGRGTAPLPQVVERGARWPVRRRKLPKIDLRRTLEEQERERRMVQEYLDELERKQKSTPSTAAEVSEPAALPPSDSTVPVVPRLTEAMARAAHANELQRIAEHAATEAADRVLAEQERRRRQRAAAAAVMVMSH